MSSVLLVKLPYRFATRNLIINSACVPTRQAYLGAILRNAGINYDVLDLNIESINTFGVKKHNLYCRLLDAQSLSRYCVDSVHHRKKKAYLRWIRKMLLRKAGSKFVAVNGDNLWMAQNVLRIAKSLDDRTVTIIGGRRVTDSPYTAISDKSVDFVCRGYGDENLPRIVQGKMNSRISTDDNRNHGILKPDYSKIKLKSYFRHFNSVNLVTSMGCNSKCSFCGYTGRTSFHVRDIKSVSEEVSMFTDAFGIRNFALTDSSINHNPGHFNKLTDMFKNFDISYGGFFLPTLSRKSVQNLDRSGCFFTSFGIESVVPKLQQCIKKKSDISRFRKIVRMLKSRNIITRASFMYDLPGETLSDFINSYRYSQSLSIDYAAFHKLSIIPGSEMYNSAHEIFPCIVRQESLDRIRSPRQLVELGLKQCIAGLANRHNASKFTRDKRIRNFIFAR